MQSMKNSSLLSESFLRYYNVASESLLVPLVDIWGHFLVVPINVNTERLIRKRLIRKDQYASSSVRGKSHWDIALT
jgi:hypothetical protein